MLRRALPLYQAATVLTSSEFARPTGLSIQQIWDLGDRLAAGQGYHEHRQRKRHGGSRLILVPEVEVHAALKLIRIRLQGVLPYEAPPYVFGFVAGRGIVGNASCHLGQDVVLTVDLQNFFGAIDPPRVRSALQKGDLSDELVNLLLSVVVTNGSLPAGFSTSPFLSNVVFEAADGLLADFSNGCGVSYSRYADDLTFSGNVDDSFLNEVVSLLATSGWRANRSKIRFMRRGGPQYVTGLYVGDPKRPHIPRRMKRKLRMWMHYVAKYGHEDCANYGGVPSLGQLSGWLRHLRQVDQEAARKLALELNPVDSFYLWGPRTAQRDPDLSDSWDELIAELGLDPTK